jgi:hypothetical protein
MEHFYENIQNWFDYQSVYNRMVNQANDGDLFVEIGVWKGGSTAYMGVEILNSGKAIKYHAIDSFEGSVEIGNVKDWLFDETSKNLKPLTDIGIVQLIKSFSLDAVKNYEDESIDFCFIDGSHEYEDVKQDIIQWLKKVKRGGILAGHDYTHNCSGVFNAVNEILGANCISVENVVFIYKKP